MLRWSSVLVGLSVLCLAQVAQGFCGFYVSGADSKLYNNATMVVMMRDGTRTILSMQNNYQGPPSDFAMVVPVPVVLQEGDVKTLPSDVFDRVDQLAAPRLVEYWEQDPCGSWDDEDEAAPMLSAAGAGPLRMSKRKADLGVTVEAEFEVGEYEVVILSAKDSGGLDTWLRQEKYKIPAGAEPVLRPYVQRDMKFFVAKVNAKKVTFRDGQAMLSPLRFHYDEDTFSLPVRLGMLNSSGKQDLIVHILSQRQRYEVANYNNVTIPTNLSVTDDTRKQFGSFYARLFDRTLEQNPRSVVTEYAWDAGSCDPCPTPPLTSSDLMTLGADVIGSPAASSANRSKRRASAGFVLTRLHARYASDSLGEDLVFREATPMVGGREFLVSPDGDENGAGQKPGEPKLEQGGKEGSINNFQARYAIRHTWTGPISCENPRRGIWGGPPNGGEPKPAAAQGLAFVARDVSLTSFVPAGVPELGLLPGQPDTPASGKTEGLVVAGPPAEDSPAPAPSPPQGGCAGCRIGDTQPSQQAPWILAVGLALTLRRRLTKRYFTSRR